ncbi:MAG: glycosyltransferase [Candidatus Aegiribacteria sp.]|nr:glycosyltransferase [Candidatus Aegiribacteria sp.]MBD3293865.1 glycosyltransferase [Candidatus Fermentibacteria bacterium]
MRIGIKISPLTVLRAGIPNYILNLLQAFARLDDDNEYFLYTNRPLPFQLNLPDRFRTVLVRFPSPALQMWYQIGLPLRIKKDDIDIFHDPVYPLPFVLPVPGVITIHDLSNYTSPGSHKLRSVLSGRFFPSHLRKARSIIADSAYTASEIQRLFPWASGKVTVIHLGVSKRFRPVTSRERLDSVREQYHLPDRFMLFLGTLEPRKNIAGLLDAFGRVSSEIPHSLVITGGRGWKFQSMLSRVESHSERERIHLTGFVSDEHLPAILSLAEFLVYPSFLEGFGFPILEAMACGTPVITSNTSSMPEIAGEAARFVDPRSVESISEGILDVANSKDLRSRMSASGLRRAEKFDWKKTAAATLEVYRESL